MARASQEDWTSVVEKLEKQTKSGELNWYPTSSGIAICVVLGWTLMLEKLDNGGVGHPIARLHVIRGGMWTLPNTPYTLRLYNLVVSKVEMTPEFASVFAAEFLKERQ